MPTLAWLVRWNHCAGSESAAALAAVTARTFYAARWRGQLLTKLRVHVDPPGYINAWNSDSVSSISHAPRFSLRWASERVPGIGSMVGERRNSQASVICAEVAR